MTAARQSLRRSERLDVVMAAHCRSRTGFVDRVVISDITREGCRVASAALTVRAGDPVVVKMQSLEGVCGIVRWVLGHTAGIEFTAPLYGPVVEHLHRTHREFLPAQGQPCTGTLRHAA